MPKNVVIIPASGLTYFNNTASQTIGQILVDPVTEEFLISGITLNFESSTSVNVGSGYGDVYIGDGITPTNIIFEENGSIKGDGTAIELTLGSSTDYVKISSNGQFDLIGIVSASTPSSVLSYNSSTNRVTYSPYTSSSGSGSFLPLSGGTVSGATNFTGGLSANTISATTYQGNVVTKISSGIDSTGNTTTGSYQLVQYVLIPANTVKTGDVVLFKARYRKVGANAAANYRITINTTLNLTGAQVVGQFNSGLTILYTELSRTAAVKGGTSEVFNTSITNVQSDVTTSTSAVTTLTIDWTVNQYVMYSILNSSASDTTFVSYYSINQI